MKTQISWKVGGQQGEGIESTGEIFSTALNRLGYYLYGYRHFSSRIKGGHTNNKIRVSTRPVYAISDDLDILVAFDQETIDLNYHELTDEGIILADSKFDPVAPEDYKGAFISMGFTEIAKDLGTALMKNMVAVGATANLIGADLKHFEVLVDDLFAKKGEKICTLNKEALHKGYAEIESHSELTSDYKLEPSTEEGHLFMIGNEAISLGALAGGARFMAAYPITPASEIMEYMIDKLPRFGGTVIQTEDEIAAAVMAIGVNYAGVRAFTASSGPGLSLMMEAIGLSGMTEQPLVIVNTMRGGPSTGLPTKQEQSDLMQMIYGTHGEIPKIVLAPTTAEDAFYLTNEAFNLAEVYQCPVIILSDLQLSLGKQTVPVLDYNKINIDRGSLVTEVEATEDKAYFKRYAITDNGISPRTIPGVKNGIHHVTGVEHNEEGKPSESPVNRAKQMEKRMRKLEQLKITEPVVYNVHHEDADVLVIGYISTYGAIDEAIQRVEGKVNHLHMKQLHPFPAEEVQQAIDKAKKVIVVEHNFNGQLGQIIKMNTNHQGKMIQMSKYDGTPYLPHEIEEKINATLKELI
ncbi:2-oxoacid:acceptor oxidoreductase subunit alpha [Macrococcoides canis]|uniref:2-oxoacid:acceptor oxidoreductase subunit alpha n=3 Tax=Macrococcoides canis TaxID=1855823 RepID=A0A4R6C6J8_9STAP|nr:2-oxoacid:acceptor oxidoreductase subunit alpha [Macrococcus canis]TDM18053.1 2-oxoacid:acceptor oxidoreductase subunit alpha [Macrococcus canis]TDM21873.1 2-oxoacid:acceptor oxidoreductase subunit alpha [Macrococcus canis]TDM32656.1 2-oxoacid:acceptor oxidoreductase subunit alpha [Macrococcus canis]TDM34600.1 2-oxoacid:acceptor oxidoreductase subunit alpha [Macrococcus canis]TDM38014.1 2-oxoacid:acceptor oxidoreductase subunit alpha [Macrococcus canis]